MKRLTALVCLAAACGGDSTGPNGAATALAIVIAPAGTIQSGQALAPQPVVELRNAKGQPVAKAGVEISAALDHGTLSGTLAVTTTSDGRATFTGLAPSGAPGSYTLTFSSPGLASATQTLTLSAGSSASMQAQSSAAQSGPAGGFVSDPPAVIVKDASGNGLAGVAVTFAVTSGGGNVAGGSAVTDAAGTARVTSWALGPTPGANSVAATTGAIPGASVVFQATGTPAPHLVFESGPFTGQVGQAPSPAPAVVVTDANGAPMPGVTVSFAVTAGGGTLSASSVTTGADGRAVADWTLGTITGSNTLSASALDLAPVSLTIAAQSGPAVSMTLAQGDNQSAVIWHTLPVAPAVVFRDQYGNGATNTSATFSVVSGGGRLTTPVVAPGSDGIARAAWSLGPSPGPNSLTATAQGGALGTITFNATALPTSSPYNIDVRVVGTLTAAEQSAVDAAVTRWRVVVSGDLPSTSVNVAAGSCIDPQPAFSGTVDDLVIFVAIDSIDGPGNILGGAGPCILRATGGLPSLGGIELDSADVNGLSQGELNDLILHEMGHVLGFGTIWASPLLTGAGTSDPRFTGANAVAGYHELGGQQASVPVENTGGSGTADSHWRESVFANELMTGYIGGGGNPLTGMTIGSLQDLGYSVDYASAEPLGFTVSFARTRVPSGPQLREMPLRSPILIMAPDGTVVGRRNR